jgi:RNA polymerase sigma-70 factor (ECF subfamily)
VAWRKVDDMPGGEETLPWLYRIASYEVSTVRRSGRRLASLRGKLSGVRVDSSPTPDAVVVRRAEHAAIVDALWSLPAPDREVILLRTYEELSTAQAALALGCSQEAAKKRLSRALRRLRKAAGLPEPAAMSESRAIQERGDG